jgi:hypothetical protein
MPRNLAPINEADDLVDKAYADNLITTANLTTPVRAIEQTAVFNALGISNGTYFIDERVPRALTIVRLRTLRNVRASGASFTFSLTNNEANITGVSTISGSTVQLANSLTASVNNIIAVNGSLAFVISGIASGTIDLLFSFDYTE